MKTHKFVLLVPMLCLPYNAAHAAVANSNNIWSNLNHNYTYSNLFTRNNFTFPIHVRNLTEHYADTITEAGNRINAAFGHTAILDAPSVNPPFLNTIFLFEMNLANTAWLGASIPYHVDSAGNPTACFSVSWTNIDANNDLIGFTTDPNAAHYQPCAGNVAVNLPNQTNPTLGTVKSGLNAGMIVFNNYVYSVYTAIPARRQIELNYGAEATPIFSQPYPHAQKTTASSATRDTSQLRAFIHKTAARYHQKQLCQNS